MSAPESVPLNGAGVRVEAVDLDFSDPYMQPYAKGPFRTAARAGCMVFWTCVAIVALVLVIVLPLTFSYVSYEHWALKKNSVTNAVSTDQVYGYGRYAWGPTYTTLTFPRHYTYNSECLDIFNEGGVEFQICVEYFWRIREQDLLKLFAEFPSSYADQVVSRSNTEIKNLAPKYTINDYKTKRPEIRKALHAAMAEALLKIHIDLPEYLFSFSEVLFPNSIVEKDIDAAIQQQVNVQEVYEQDRQLVLKGTQRLSEQIRANTTIIAVGGDSQVRRIRVDAQAQSDKIYATSDNVGLYSLFQNVGLDAGGSSPQSVAVKPANADAIKARYIEYFAFREKVEQEGLGGGGSNISR